MTCPKQAASEGDMGAFIPLHPRLQQEVEQPEPEDHPYNRIVSDTVLIGPKNLSVSVTRKTPGFFGHQCVLDVEPRDQGIKGSRVKKLPFAKPSSSFFTSKRLSINALLVFRVFISFSFKSFNISEYL